MRKAWESKEGGTSRCFSAFGRTGFPVSPEGDSPPPETLTAPGKPHSIVPDSADLSKARKPGCVMGGTRKSLPRAKDVKLSRRHVVLVAVVVVTALLRLSAARAEDQSQCSPGPHALWGDGGHDDTAALNAWFRGETVVWAQTGIAVGAAIADRTFLLSSTVYVSGGTGLRLEHFRMIWPWRNEVVSGGAILTGNDPGQEPRTEGITMVGADPDEGVPYKAPAPEPREHGIPRHCLTS